jgi:DhnA family fructose-bisphosphate aldolase class Ia
LELLEEMNMIVGKAIGMNRIINPSTKRSFILNVGREVILKNFTDVEEVLQVFKNCCDGVVVRFEQVERLLHHFLGRTAPALIVEASLKSASQVGSSLQDKVSGSSKFLVENALLLGASAILGYLFVGYERDEDEARNVELIAHLAWESEKAGLPLIVECIPFGERVTRENFPKCVELAARVSSESGADVIAIPYTGDYASFCKIVDGVGIPVLTLDMVTPFGWGVENIVTTLKAGSSGIIVTEETLQRLGFSKLRSLYDFIHGRVEAWE